ncbi:hypothetical protein CCR75_007755 [Bremia lactucae]|uniref:Cyclin N-terminal domain-containing protein n=1 Tax=Bremia lactucae TaxID=4779 RepID=A0A976FER7_BRELC|nr:hypothetical protein CCR75_007755 [Bremia lactucae]
MSFVRRSIRINNENEVLTNRDGFRPAKRQIEENAEEAGNAEKHFRLTKQPKTDSNGGIRRTALGDVTNRRSVLGNATNRISIKKSTVSSMSTSLSTAGAVFKKKITAGKRSLRNVNIGSRSLNTANSSKRDLENINESNCFVATANISKRNLDHVSVGCRHAIPAPSVAPILCARGSSSSSITEPMSRSTSSVTLVVNTCETMGQISKLSPKFNIVSPTIEKKEHDIDSKDKNDPTACWQYAEEITKYHLETEKNRRPNGSYMAHQSNINSKMRAILVDWLVDVHYKYGLLSQTLHIAILLIDYFLEKNLSIGRRRLQLVGVTAMFIASKYEDIYPPEAEEFVKITDNAYTREEVFQMEAKMLATIGFRVTFPTAFQFMRRFIKASRTCNDRVEHFAHYVIDRSLQEYKLIKYLPSTIAASAVYVARTQMRDIPAWSSTMEHHSTYSEQSLTSCVNDIKEMLWNAHNGVGKLAKLTAVRRKFSKARFLAVAAEPLAFRKSI